MHPVALLLLPVLGIACSEQLDRSHFSDTFDEEVLIKPLQNGHVYSHFQFTTRWDVNGNQSYSHYRLFPKSLGEILEKYQVEELHLSLTQGLWKYSSWGYPVVGAPPGAQLWVWFKKETKNIDANWLSLCNALSGLFCASLNFIDQTNTVCPSLSFRPSGLSSPHHHARSQFVRYATVPQEIVCTENLTPWKKLLPCSAMAGIGTLISGRELFNTQYNSQGIRVRQICANLACGHPSLEFSQTISLVSESPDHLRDKPDWSLKKLYGSMLFRNCPVATRSFIYIDLSQNESGNTFVLSPPPKTIIVNDRKDRYAAYDVRELVGESSPANIMAVYERPLSYGVIRPPRLLVNRYIKENGKWSGTIHCRIRHTRSKRPLRIVYMEQIPSFARVYANTFKIVSNGRPLKPEFVHIAERRMDNLPFLLEAVFALPPDSTTEITLQFEKTFLKWNDYPPDANHGFYIGSAVISTDIASAENHTLVPQNVSGLRPELHRHSETYFLRIYTESLLLALPTPDFSMPYNVICLVCTVVAFAFGPLHNVTTKRLTLASQKTKRRFLFW